MTVCFCLALCIGKIHFSWGILSWSWCSSPLPSLPKQHTARWKLVVQLHLKCCSLLPFAETHSVKLKLSSRLSKLSISCSFCRVPWLPSMIMALMLWLAYVLCSSTSSHQQRIQWCVLIDWFCSQELGSAQSGGHSQGDKGWKTVSVGHCFFCIFDNSRKDDGQAISGEIAPRLYNAASLPMRKAHTCSQVWAPVHTASAPKQSKLDVMLRFQPLSSQDCHSLNLRGWGGL